MGNLTELNKSVFNTLYEIDTRERSVQKDTGRAKLNYLPWATTYSEVCKSFDDVNYEFKKTKIHKEHKKITKVDENTTIEDIDSYEVEIPYIETDAGLMVSTTVTIKGVTKEMCLPVYDTSFKCMRLNPYTYKTSKGDKEVKAATFDDIYKSIMRCFAKNLSMWGVGLNYWTKEDAPESVLKMEKLLSEIDSLYVSKKKKGFTDEEIMGAYSKLIPEEFNGNYKLCEDETILEDIKKKLLALRK